MTDEEKEFEQFKTWRAQRHNDEEIKKGSTPEEFAEYEKWRSYQARGESISQQVKDFEKRLFASRENCPHYVPGKNPFTKEAWNATAQNELALHDRQLAIMLAEQAGNVDMANILRGMK